MNSIVKVRQVLTNTSITINTGYNHVRALVALAKLYKMPNIIVEQIMQNVQPYYKTITLGCKLLEPFEFDSNIFTIENQMALTTICEMSTLYIQYIQENKSHETFMKELFYLLPRSEYALIPDFTILYSNILCIQILKPSKLDLYTLQLKYLPLSE